MINVEYRPESDLMDVVLTGKIQFAQMKEYCLNLLRGVSTPNCIRILEDASSAELQYDIDDAENLGSIIESELGQKLIVRHALIRRNPLDTAFGMIRVQSNSCDRYQLKVFSTPENGRHWLLNEN
ncbi:hypothetical protein DF185_03810 [Marinifilum breve]|uniref:Uncharacterized protein n=1 Tax=Marinifilum breve TaxID=2184082 RepID=A0A2V4A332_9BACT|nr:hypothetical protein [Marinifilum breve]PXY03219.1 hypothetical protein DF185_03810 [Marinifilum breve]